MRKLIFALQTESENAKPKALPILIFPKSISEALLSSEPWSLSFPKTMKEGEINNTWKGTPWIKWSVKSDIYAVQWNQCPNSGPGFQMRVLGFSIETLLTLSSFCFFVFWKNVMACPRLDSHSSSPYLFISVEMIGIGYYTYLLLLYSIILPNPSCPPIAVIDILLGETHLTQKFRSQYAVPTSGAQNPQYGFLFSIVISVTAVELRLNIDAYETPSFRLPHALSLGLQRYFKRVICPTC